LSFRRLRSTADEHADLACMSQALYTVSLYDTLGPSAVEYIINHAQLSCIAVSLPHIPTVLKLKPRLPSLKIIISLDPLEDGDRPGHSKYDVLTAMASDMEVRIYSMQQIEALGKSLGSPVYHVPSPSDIITINYTSGTTGPPKGVVLTHYAAVAATGTALTLMPGGPSDVYCSYLPLAHIFERLSEHGALWLGAAIGYFHGDILALVDDLKLLRPTGFISVPRLYNRFGGAVRAATTAQPGVKGALARHIVSTKTAALQHPDSPDATNKHAIYDRIWGRKVASALGLDRARTMVSGSAPLDPSLQTFLRVVFGNRLAQGYGLTETYACGLVQIEGDLSVGTCGAVVPSNEICLANMPDMEYLVTDQPQPRGELLLRGPTLFSGYYKNKEETEKCMLPDGWFRTGDIATVDSRGRFKIIDRVKNVLKLAQGEYISPERTENVYLSHLNFLAQAYVHGDSVQTFLVALFGVMPEMFAPFASKVLGRTIAATDLQAVAAACKNAKVRAAVVKEMDKVGKKNNFAGYERVRNCYLYLEPFTIDNELLTPT
jgi:long-chain acyl-CoA synthetase